LLKRRFYKMTEKQLTANRKNALKSTGPKTTEGKARTSMNALKHGLRASSLAVPILENAEDWETHRDLVVRDLSPVGYLETVLSERVAAILWRLGRVVRYESATVTAAINEVKESVTGVDDDPELAKKRAETLSRVRSLKPKAHVSGKDVEIVLDLVAESLDVDLSEDKSVEALEVPENFPDDYYWGDWDGWTREALEAAVQSIKAQASEEDPGGDPWEEAAKEASLAVFIAQNGQREKAAYLDKKRHEALLLPDETLDKVSRYETTLERSLFRTIHELQRLQAARTGGPLLPPASVDVDLSVHQET
jgi:hypothetical protein